MRAELGPVLPALRQASAARDGEAADERYHTHRALARLLELLAERKGLVLLLDDLHWADSGSVELLGSLLRRPPAGVLLGLALRPAPAARAARWAPSSAPAATGS